eukprot:COSAG01_NODE_73564_length_242_cov_6.258741_1_plen_57_part_01
MGKGLPGGRKKVGRIDYRTEPCSSHKRTAAVLRSEPIPVVCFFLLPAATTFSGRVLL